MFLQQNGVTVANLLNETNLGCFPVAICPCLELDEICCPILSLLSWDSQHITALFCVLTPAQVTVYECSDAGSMVPVRAYADAEVS